MRLLWPAEIALFSNINIFFLGTLKLNFTVMLPLDSRLKTILELLAAKYYYAKT